MLASLPGILFDGFAYGMLLFLLSVGLSVTLGMMNFINLAHCSFGMLGAYTAVTLMDEAGWPFVAALGGAFVSAMLAAIIIERLLFRRMYRASDLDQCLVTIGVAFMSIASFAWFYTTEPQSARPPAYLLGSVELMGRSFGVYRMFLALAGLVVTALLVYSLE